VCSEPALSPGRAFAAVHEERVGGLRHAVVRRHGERHLHGAGSPALCVERHRPVARGRQRRGGRAVAHCATASCPSGAVCLSTKRAGVVLRGRFCVSVCSRAVEKLFVLPAGALQVSL
jgi:hypothetical protein